MTAKFSDMSFFDHLGELRKRILYSFAFILIFFLVSWTFVDKLYHWFSIPVLQFLPAGEKLAFTSLTEPFMMYIKIAFISGAFISSPFIFYQLWAFITPGLYKNEKKMVIPFVFFTTFFFILGGAFGYYAIFPWACRFFLEVGSDFNAIITINEYFSLAFRVLLGISLIFELPVLSFLLAKMGIITSKFLIKHFKYAIVLIFVIAAVITPTPDIITQSMFAIPMMLLYLLSVLIVKIVGPKEEKEKIKKKADKA
ncbi:MAG: twin-arginine translocase subunit TatC [Candidatus Aminicenantes bacterium]|nr:twin-arginine translocase subunit TatC [Candidatus Aminicenantes bacterium]MCK5003768.1 twin-arginine translocase subunit TatC [Candidatus Aminicenantes bacterium]